ncbi:MAG TPA: TIGR03620 family F420-dependent LLM class oxidoreductase [Pseudonocardiaceae bacterium]|jgi:probable F420-dependent oxidoreductase|nr:TIGR03620 family F420-dependent LLM class oxidoreductase [Pseudonocardiaceae bacterium]
MPATDVVTTARRALGPVGAYLGGPMTGMSPIAEQRREVARLERLGYGSVWTNDQISGKDIFAHLAVLLAATDRIVVGSSVANIWGRHPATMHGGGAVLAEAYPDRVVLGVGVSVARAAEFVGASYDRPLRTMREYLDGMDAPPFAAAPPSAPFPRVLAAIGPKMAALAGERTDGAIPFGMPVAHTAATREIIGPDKLLIVGQQTVFDTDRDRAREIAREQKAAMVKGNPGSPYLTNLTRFGITADEIANVTDSVVDATTAYGDESAILDRVRAQLDAGADQVLLFLSGDSLTATGDVFERLAEPVASLRG